jgi:hypothetical protein
MMIASSSAMGSRSACLASIEPPPPTILRALQASKSGVECNSHYGEIRDCNVRRVRVKDEMDASSSYEQVPPLSGGSSVQAE